MMAYRLKDYYQTRERHHDIKHCEIISKLLNLETRHHQKW